MTHERNIVISSTIYLEIKRNIPGYVIFTPIRLLFVNLYIDEFAGI